MAIAFARPEYVGRSDNKNACCKSSYNSRSKIVDERTGKVFNFTSHGGNAYHEMLLPEYVDKKFKNAEGFSNEVERAEKRKDSQLYVEWLLALPKEKEITLEMKQEIIKEFIERKGWIKEGLGVQIDIHKPHDGEKNWHAHLLVTTRRFRKDGLGLEDKKAVDLQPEIKYGKVQKTAEIDNHKFYENVLNDKFKGWGLDLRADLPGAITQEHVGPVRMRSIFNQAAKRNEERKEAEIEHLNSGERVLEKVTKYMSVFTKGDLVRAVKCIPDSEVRARLVEDALSAASLVPLVTNAKNSNGQIKYYTTSTVRDEEQKIMRLSSYVANLDNVIFGGTKIKQAANDLISDSKDNLSDEQHKALSEILLGKSGLRVLRGRAGTGKSYVLGKVNSIATSSGVNVIGLSPTHKARLGLASCGYERVDTIKGMLFKLSHGRFDLPKHSLIVVDEAGMVGNDDYKELLRVAATRKCNVILAGDERQLASVQRGGMFEVFADRYGSSSILDIKRQDSDWGRSVAMNMSAGNVETAISILDKENRIKWESDTNSSMELLLADWHKSEHDISNRLILAVKNKDVASINHGVRQYLKLEGKLTGTEISAAGNHYMQGDRILITKTNKDLGLINGDLAEITELSEQKFTIRIKDGVGLKTNPTNATSESKESVVDYRNISFNPSEYNGFRHGYATTIFKAQGASIADVYMFHNGFAGIRNSYVSLSRNKMDLNLYVNKESTANTASLIRQLSQDAEAGSSLNYLTKSELEDRELSYRLTNDKNALIRGLSRLVNFTFDTATKFTDKYIPSTEYYNYKEPKQKYESVVQVIDKTYEEITHVNQAIMEDKMVVGGSALHSSDKPSATSNNISTSVNNKNMDNHEFSTISSQTTGKDKIMESAKTRFYVNADRIRRQQRYESQKAEWGREYDHLQSEIRFKAESITRDLLGDPNKRLSNGRELRYGDHGKIAVRITGEKAGTWYDFAKGEGGDLFHLAQEAKNTSFKEAAEYLRRQVGLSSSNTKPNLQLVHDHANSDLTIDRIKSNESEKRLSEQKQAYSTKLFERSKDIGEKSVAYRYLSGTRGINIDLGNDIKTAGIYEKSHKGYLPALIAYARDKEGNITGGQHLLLDKKTNNKVGIDNPKKSFGSISGSFVDLGNIDTRNITDIHSENSKISDITIIAEGIETGLSVKQSLYEHSNTEEAITANIHIKTLCSLGVGNIKNYEPASYEKIIIAADNDGKDMVTAKTIANAKSVLEEKGAFVEIVKPENDGDFNDVLQDKENGGSRVIADCFKGAINKHSAKTLEEYIANIDTSRDMIAEGHQYLNEQDKANIAIIQKYNISQENILNAWRRSPEKGKEELTSAASEISLIEKSIEINRCILDLAANYSIKVDEANIVKTLLKSPISCKQECINHVLSGFAKQKQEAEKIGQVFNIIKKEDQFLSNVNIQDNKGLDSDLQDRLDLSKSGQSKSVITGIKESLIANHKQGIISYDDLLKKVVASGYDIKGLDVSLEQLAVNGRERHLQAIRIELSELEKLKCSPDQDKLVGDLKFMSYKEREQHGDKLLGEAAKQHIEPTLNKYNNERNSTSNFWKFLDIVGKEQSTYKEMYSNHRFALRSLDRQNGDLKFSTIGSWAYQIDRRSSTEGVISMLGFAVKNNLVSQDKIIKEINLRSGDLSSIYYYTKTMCDDYKSEQEKSRIKDQNSLEKENLKTEPAKSFYHSVLVTFNNEPTKDIKKTIESFGIHFNKFSQEWEGNVKEQDLSKLTKSLAREKHSMDIGLKLEHRESPKQENQQEMKIDRGFSM